MQMIKHEWKNFFSNKILLVSIVVMLFIPIMYGGIFLSSVWDPYSRTEDLPVAIVNLDNPAEYGGQTLALGDKLVAELKDNHDLQWHFVTQEDADNGLENGDYYMVITVPEDFSHRASTVLDESPKEMNLIYKTNPGRSFFAEAVSKQGATNIRSSVATSLTQEYAKAIFAQITTLGDGFSEAADGSNMLTEGIDQLEQGSGDISINLQKLASSSLTFKDGVEQMKIAVGEVLTGANALNDGALQLNDGIHEYTAGVDALKTGVDKFSVGATQLSNSSSALISGSTALSEGVTKITPGIEGLHNGLAASLESSTTLSDGLKQLQVNAAKLTDEANGVPKLVTGQNNLNEGIKQLSAGSNELEQGLQQMNRGLPTEEQLAKLTNGLTNIQNAINQLAKSISAGSDISAMIADLGSNSTNMQSAISALSATIPTNNQSTINVIQDTNAFKNGLSSTEQTELIQSVGQELTKQATAQQQIIMSLSTDLNNLSTQLMDNLIPLAKGLGTLPDQVHQLNQTINIVHPKAIDIINGYTAIKQGLELQLIPGATGLNTGLTNIYQGSIQLMTGTTTLNQQILPLVKGITQLNVGSLSLTEGLTLINAGSSQLSDATKQFQTGSASFVEGVSKYSAGITELNNGAVHITTGAEQLSANSNSLKAGAETLVAGTGALANNLPALNEAAGQLSNGAIHISEGSKSLAEGSVKIEEGLATLKSGSTELSAKLSDGAAKIGDNQLTTANYEMIASPINLTQEQISIVPNYGHSLAPYVLALGLFVGCLAFNLIFPIDTPSIRPTSGFAWWGSKFSIGLAQAIFQALVLDVIMILGMGLQVDHIGQFILLSIMISITFMSLVMLLTIALGNPGRFLAMALLVLQLGASGGTFPMELTNGFFNVIHPYLPMTYAVEGFRQTVYSSQGSNVFTICILTLASFAILFNLTLILALVVHKKKEHFTSSNNQTSTM
ncbi:MULTISPECIES: YhgE/Pip domain-containing protein [Paenibacillus]|uniref:YhgE/Pip domain-containing protein n=1 Tax=Paenibacillus TaxID=44249 RepID=UPI00096FC374|nr:YhgE/Pip domain-containing protein [Paenibacillus odorifer]OME13904.1 hypothetical protein BSK60_13675 [Paenibacillus odorifer]